MTLFGPRGDASSQQRRAARVRLRTYSLNYFFRTYLVRTFAGHRAFFNAR